MKEEIRLFEEAIGRLRQERDEGFIRKRKSLYYQYMQAVYLLLARTLRAAPTAEKNE